MPLNTIQNISTLSAQLQKVNDILEQFDLGMLRGNVVIGAVFQKLEIW